MTANDEPAGREMRDRHAARVLESSVLIGTLARVLAALENAAQSSSTAARARRGLAEWHQSPRGQRRFMSGVLCVTAALGNFVLTMVGKTPPGWLWVVPPAIVMAIGATLILAAASDESPGAS
jgi:hypothetical protein